MKLALSTQKLARQVFVIFLFIGAFALSYFRILEPFELQTYDFRCRLRGLRTMSSDIALIQISDDTLKKIGQFPINRQYYAALIESLNTYGAKAVVFDITFVEPNAEADPYVVDAAEESKNAYFPVAFLKPSMDAKKGVFVSQGLLSPLLDSYAKVSRRIGFVNVEADPDAKRRRIFVSIYHQGQRYFYLPIAVAIDVMGIPESSIVEVPGKYVQLSRDLRLPIDDKGHFLISYAGKWKETFQHYSFVDVISSYQSIQAGEKPSIDLNLFRGKVCYVGETASGTSDTNGTPLEPIYAGVGIHLNVLNSILTRDFIWRLDRVQNLLLLMILSLIIYSVSLRLTPARALTHVFSVLALYISAVCLIFKLYGIWVDLFFPIFMSALVYSGTTLTKIIAEMRKRQLIENELKVASQIQKSFLPEKLPNIKGLSLAAFFKPAKAVGGDLYSFVPLSDRKIGVMLGDVSGKGTPAALFMSKVVSEFKFSSRGQQDPSASLTALNNAISSESTGGLFVTLTYVIFDLESKSLLLSNGGHLPLVLAGPNGDSELIQAEEGMPVGVMEGVSFANLKKDIQVGDCFAFYSDGVSEARNKKKEEFGIEALLAAVKKYRAGTAKEILDKTMKDLEHFMGRADQHDDITLIIAKIEPLT